MPHLSEDQEAALKMAMDSKLWFSDAKMKVQVVELMCNFAKQKNEGIRQAYEMVNDENAELKLQVEALTQALETQKRENQPYIKELEGLLKQAKCIMERNMEPNPDQHATSDMMHFVYNELEELFPSQGQPLTPPEA